jgi:hypothetical protein
MPETITTNSSGDDVRLVQQLIQACEAKDPQQFQQLLLSHSSSASATSASVTSSKSNTMNAWMDELARQLLQEETSNAALLVVGALVQLDVQKYLLPIATSVRNRVSQPQQRQQQQQTNDLYVSDALLQVWMQQLTLTSQVAVHEQLLQALLECVKRLGPKVLEPSMFQLVTIWKEQQLASSNSKEASIVTVRCATVMMEHIDQLGDVALHVCQAHGAMPLLVQMMESVSDPLLQLSVLDLFPEHLTASNLQVATKEWLTSTELAQPILHLLDDPLLSGAAMSYLSLVCSAPTTSSVDEDQYETRLAPLRQALLQHISELGPTTAEADRLQIVQALSCMAKANAPRSVSLILQTPSVRLAWWDMRRISSPKLQAAILSSIAQVLAAAKSNDKSMDGLQLYSLLAQDNGYPESTTTAWMYTKYVRSPMPELRIASYAIWTAVASLSGGTTTLTTSLDFTQWLLQEDDGRQQRREATSDARVAKYELLKTIAQHSQGFLAKELETKLDKLLKLGPHGMNPMQWDVAVE